MKQGASWPNSRENSNNSWPKIHDNGIQREAAQEPLSLPITSSKIQQVDFESVQKDATTNINHKSNNKRPNTIIEPEIPLADSNSIKDRKNDRNFRCSATLANLEKDTLAEIARYLESWSKKEWVAYVVGEIHLKQPQRPNQDQQVQKEHELVFFVHTFNTQRLSKFRNSDMNIDDVDIQFHGDRLYSFGDNNSSSVLLELGDGSSHYSIRYEYAHEKFNNSSLQTLRKNKFRSVLQSAVSSEKNNNQKGKKNDHWMERFQHLFEVGTAGLMRAAQEGRIDPSRFGQTEEGLKKYEQMTRNLSYQNESFEHVLYPWQISLFEQRIEGEANPFIVEGKSIPISNRSIIFLVDPIGDVGKTTYLRHLDGTKSNKYQRLQLGISANDFFFQVKPTIDTYLIDVPRTKIMKISDYEIIESLKDGGGMSAKYTGNKMELRKKKPNVILFMNDLPDTSQLSANKYEIYFITQVDDGCRLIPLDYDKILDVSFYQSEKIRLAKKDRKDRTKNSYREWLYPHFMEDFIVDIAADDHNKKIMSLSPPPYPSITTKSPNHKSHDIELSALIQMQMNKETPPKREDKISKTPKTDNTSRSSTLTRTSFFIITDQKASKKESTLEEDKDDGKSNAGRIRLSDGDEEEVKETKTPQKRVCKAAAFDGETRLIQTPSPSSRSQQQLRLTPTNFLYNLRAETVNTLPLQSKSRHLAPSQGDHAAVEMME